MAGMPDLGKQVGPLPLGAWIIVVGGGLGIAWYTRRNSQVVDVPVNATDGNPGVGVGPGWIAVPPPTDAPANTAPTSFSDNDAWGAAAVRLLIALNFDPSVADTAVRKYLESSPLSLQENAMIAMVLARQGPAPYSPGPPPDLPVAPPPTVTPPPVVTPPPPPPPGPPSQQQFRIHVVTPSPTKGSTLWGIASIYYGNGARWPELWNANRAGTTRADGNPGFISNPNYLRPGDRVLVP